MAEVNKLSTTQLAKKRGMAPSLLFAQLSELDLLKKEND